MWRAFFDRYRLAVREARVIRVSLLLSVAVLVLHLILVTWFIAPRLGAPFFALHYTVYFGVDQVGPAWQLLAAPGLGALILLVNAALATHFYVQNRWAGLFLSALSFFLQLLLAVSTFLIVLLNL
jgi:hypothetical protein